MEIHPKHKFALDAIRRAHPATMIPTRCYNPDEVEKYYAKHAVEARRVDDRRCFKGEICLAFFDADGAKIGGYFIRPDQEYYVLQRIIGK